MRTKALVVKVDIDRLRRLGLIYRKDNFSTQDAKAFLTLYRKALEDRMNAAVRDFIKEKL